MLDKSQGAANGHSTACLTPTDADPIPSLPAPAGGPWILPRAGSEPIRVDILSPGPMPSPC